MGETGLSIRPSKSDAFTLTELLVTIGTIGVIASLTLPALSSAKAKARYIECVNNQRQVFQIATMVASDHWPNGNTASIYQYSYQYDQNGNLTSISSWISDEGIAFYNDLYKSLAVNQVPDPYLTNYNEVRPPLLNCPTAKKGNPSTPFNAFSYTVNGNLVCPITTTCIYPEGLDVSAPQTSVVIQDIYVQDGSGVCQGFVGGQTINFVGVQLHRERGPGVVATMANGSTTWIPPPAP